MGASCCCLRDNLEDFADPGSSIYRNCICLQYFVHNLFHVYTSVLHSGEHNAIQSEQLQGSDSDDDMEFVCTRNKLDQSCEEGSKADYSKSLPTLSITETKTGFAHIYPSSDDEDVCPTCLEEYDEENPKIITKCSHHYHLGCIYEWMERSENCPVCGKVMEFDERT